MPAPPVKAPTGDAPQAPAPTSPPKRKRSVRIISPRPSPSPETAAHVSPDSSPSPILSPRFASGGAELSLAAAGGQDGEDEGGRRRETSPYNPEGPRPSQRNREEERMFAEMYGGEEDEDEETEGREGRDIGGSTAA